MYVCIYIYIYIYIYIIWCRVATSQAPPLTPLGMPPPQASLSSHVYNCRRFSQYAPAPSQPLALANGPLPLPLPFDTKENDGDDVVHNGVDVLFPVWLLVVPLLLCCPGLRQRSSLLYLVENRAWLVMFFGNRALSFQDKFRLGSLKVSLSTCLNDFHSGLLSKGPEEIADGDHDTIFVIIIIITITFITIIGFRAQGRSEFSGTVPQPKVQTLSNRTPNQQ